MLNFCTKVQCNLYFLSAVCYNIRGEDKLRKIKENGKVSVEAIVLYSLCTAAVVIYLVVSLLLSSNDDKIDPTVYSTPALTQDPRISFIKELERAGLVEPDSWEYLNSALAVPVVGYTHGANVRLKVYNYNGVLSFSLTAENPVLYHSVDDSPFGQIEITCALSEGGCFADDIRWLSERAANYACYLTGMNVTDSLIDSISSLLLDELVFQEDPGNSVLIGIYRLRVIISDEDGLLYIYFET